MGDLLPMILKEKTQTRRLPVRLTKEEKIEKCLEVIGVLSEISEVEARLSGAKDLVKTIKEILDTHIARNHALADIVTSGQEDRPVDCDEIFDYMTSRVITRRCDTGAVISIRNMSDMELQPQQRLYEKEAPADREEIEGIVIDFLSRGGTADGKEIKEPADEPAGGPDEK